VKWILIIIIEVDGVKMINDHPTKISVIIRTYNEEKWIGHCLDAVFNQKVNASIEVILVDNSSTDHTVEIAKRFPVKEIISIKKFLPGKALNDGIRRSTGNYIVCLSSHCIPEKETWLQTMMDSIKKEPKVAGVYGRQLPLSFTDPIDKRDLLIVFGLDKRVQKKDYFFHNANSMIPRIIWENFPFDEKVTNIEDRLWGKVVIKNGYNIIYEPEAAVYHHHGLHQGNDTERASGVVAVLEKIDGKTMNHIPNSMLPEKLNIAAIIPIKGKLSTKDKEFDYLKKLVKDLEKSKYLKSIYCICEDALICSSLGIKWLDRRVIKNSNSLSLNKLLLQATDLIEAEGDFPESILYANHDYLSRPVGIFDELIEDAQYKGCDTVFPGLVDYGHYWYNNEKKEFAQTDPSLKPREKRDPLYKALYGLGCLTATWVIRSGQMIGGKVGILALEDSKYSRRNFRS